jgi:glutamine cyclotransferase
MLPVYRIAIHLPGRSALLVQLIIHGFSCIVVHRMRPHCLLLRLRLGSRLLAAFALAACGCADVQNIGSAPGIPTFGIPQSTGRIPVLTVKLVRTYPHDPHAFTQGLEYYGGYLYESTGIAGQSTLRKVALDTGQVIQKVGLPSEYFGEGLTIFRGKIYQLTWLSKKGFVYNLRTFRQVGEFPYETEGWGLTHDDKSLIMTDGTNKIRYIDPVSFAVTRTIELYAEGPGVANLNELEYVKGEILANIWRSTRIARVDPRSGQIVAWIDLSSIAAKEPHREEEVLNGIAYDKAGDRLFLTGKNWSSVFEIKVESAPH